MSTSPVNYNLQNLGQSGPQNVFGTGSNQYGAGWPTLQSPSAGSYNVPSGGPYAAQTPSIQQTQGGYYTGTTYDPTLTGSLFGYLGQQVGQGLPAYGGQLTAGPNQQYQQLANLLSGQASTLPYGQQMLQMAQTGSPTDVGPAWNAMIAAQQQNIAQNFAQLKESMAAGGNLVGTPYGTAAQDYASQTAAQQNALLAQMQQQASEAAAGRQLGAQQALTGESLALGGQLQGISQAGLTNAYNEWLRQQPQYNPLLGQAYGAATTFPSYLNPQQSPWAMLIPAILNAVGPGNLGNIISKIPGLGKRPTQTPTTTPPTLPGGSQVPTDTTTAGNYPVNFPWPGPMQQPQGLPTPPTFPGGATTGGGGGGAGSTINITMPGEGGGTIGIPPGAGGTQTPEGGIQGPSGGTVDPITGLPIDPTTGLPIGTSGPIDPTTGQPTDPLMQEYQNYLNSVYNQDIWGGQGAGAASFGFPFASGGMVMNML